ncbi:CapA family protein [Allokutzneria sp. A3M-2-11 16]|uniref:CapA family protein n=1 Tax=Allokutzneria sp. A3M-2-11 16 TaxID=2962043 RepID=UPI0020B8508D|nr:CapA family protein [Allokutzneria sp. A3M-2-11 16]MCP3800070.1 CapA family protein [Allokutzneria sp. A3M-2-11 16]
MTSRGSRTPRIAAAALCVVVLAACSPETTPPPAPSSAPASSGAGTPSSSRPDASFIVAATGDVLIHPELTTQATEDGKGRRDYGPLLAGVKRAISDADLAICHLEVPIASAGGPFKGYPNFSAPPEVTKGLADTGYDACSTASNHTIDQGAAGVARTLDALDSAGIAHTGSARSAAEAAKPRVLDVHGVKVGHVSFTFGFNGIPVPADKPWLSNKLDATAVLTAARAAKAAGAEVVLASLHWGTEFKHEPTSEQKQLARKILGDPAVDLIIGHHAHVVQPFEKIGDKWVAYGLGNHIAKHAEPRGVSEEGAIARFTFVREGTKWKVGTAEFLPTLVELGPPIRLLDLTTAPASTRNKEAVTRTERVVRSLGANKETLTRPGS